MSETIVPFWTAEVVPDATASWVSVGRQPAQVGAVLWTKSS